MIDKEIEYISIASYTNRSRVKGKSRQDSKVNRQGNTSSISQRRAGSTDQFCIYIIVDSLKIPVISIEYKLLYKVLLI